MLPNTMSYACWVACMHAIKGNPTHSMQRVVTDAKLDGNPFTPYEPRYSAATVVLFRAYRERYQGDFYLH